MPAAPLAGMGDIAGWSFQFPGEHCTECAAPDCHATCDLFVPGATGRCRRFVDGIVVRRGDGATFPYSFEVLFRPWGQIISVGNAWCVSAAAYRRFAWLIPAAGRLSLLLQSALRMLPPRLLWKVTDKIRGAGNRVPRAMNRMAARPGAPRPDRLLCVVGNAERDPVEVEVSVSGFGASQGGRSYRRTFRVDHGWRVLSVPLAEIVAVIDVKELFRVCVVPLIEKQTFLQFLYIGFVAGRPAAGQAPARGGGKIKLVVLDLDNTVWDGILLETPDRAFALYPGVREAIEELDRRGILLSIASKNNEAEARAQLERLGVWDLFLHPQINWEPKSGSVRRIVEALNIGMDAVAFVDDSEFERAEVASVLPQVRTLDARELAGLPGRPECDVPVTEESRGRRRLYREESLRQAEFAGSRLDYEAFLAGCATEVSLEPLDAANRDRVSELVQRTNQLNYSGTRYSREDLDRIVAQPGVVPVVMRSKDRFGSYGIVGFALLRAAGSAVEVSDLMFSCRIQGKRVEHAFFRHLAKCAAQGGLERVVCVFTRTARNAPAARVFADLPFRQERIEGPREAYALACAADFGRAEPVAVRDAMNIGEWFLPRA